MNESKLLALAERFEQKQEPVNMNRWFNPCGTEGCIAGEACLIAGAKLAPGPLQGEKVIMPDGREVFTALAARELLELSASQAEKLFYAGMWPLKFKNGNNYAVSGAVVAKRIRHFVATGGEE